MAGPLKIKKLGKRARRGKPIAQVAALPYRRAADGDAEILLLTSRQTGRFILPKGWPMKGRRDCEAAAQEAGEEAGVVGTLHEQSVGSFHLLQAIEGHVCPDNRQSIPASRAAGAG